MKLFTLNEVNNIGFSYVSEKDSWDDIAPKYGLARSSMIKRVKQTIGEDTYALWQSRRKEKLPFVELTQADINTVKVDDTKFKPKQKTVSKPESETSQETKPTLTFLAENTTDGSIHLTVYNQAEEIFIKTTTNELSNYIKLITEGDWDALLEASSVLKKIQAKTSAITFDVVKNKFSLAGVALSTEYEQLILNAYNQSLEEGNTDALHGLVNLVHRMNNANRMHKFSQLFEFLKHNDIKILPDGNFVAFKYLAKDVEGNYVDDYTKKIKQKVDDYVYTHEDKVKDNPNITCSYGLHVASWDYIAGKSIIAQVIVHPEDVVSIPYDYDGAKMRSKGYLITDIKEGIPSLKDFDKLPVNINPENYVYVNTTGIQE